ncbi:DUF397 domain-containing protein [Streptomyces sp. NPDC059506]|uniref:DUF397 domain-containing protein n=1 Tax=Streptomyces sp. NPDC059506 TaxID=3347751 RepID=UPI00369C0A5F
MNSSPDRTGAQWRKSSYSGDTGGDCVEVAAVAGQCLGQDEGADVAGVAPAPGVGAGGDARDQGGVRRRPGEGGHGRESAVRLAYAGPGVDARHARLGVGGGEPGLDEAGHLRFGGPGQPLGLARRCARGQRPGVLHPAEVGGEGQFREHVHQRVDQGAVAEQPVGGADFGEHRAHEGGCSVGRSVDDEPVVDGQLRGRDGDGPSVRAGPRPAAAGGVRAQALRRPRAPEVAAAEGEQLFVVVYLPHG